MTDDFKGLPRYGDAKWVYAMSASSCSGSCIARKGAAVMTFYSQAGERMGLIAMLGVESEAAIAMRVRRVEVACSDGQRSSYEVPSPEDVADLLVALNDLRARLAQAEGRRPS